MSGQTPETIESASRFVVTDQQITSRLGDESVILHLNDGIYYGLDAIGTQIWTQFESPRSIHEICHSLQQDYDVEPEACAEAVITLVQDLEVRGLIERSK